MIILKYSNINATIVLADLVGPGMLHDVHLVAGEVDQRLQGDHDVVGLRQGHATHQASWYKPGN